MTRTINIIKRAVEEFGFEFDTTDTMQDICDEAMNAIEDNVDFDYISECETNKHYSHVSWDDGKGFSYEADGEFLSTDYRRNRYFRMKDNGSFEEIPSYEQTDDDYVLMDTVVDTDGKVVALIAK